MAKAEITDTRPNYPSFAFDPDKGTPVLDPGETILIAREENGVPLYVTDGGRSIFVCSIDEFEAKIHGLHRPEIWAHYYPHATGKVKRFKVRGELQGKMAVPQDPALIDAHDGAK